MAEEVYRIEIPVTVEDRTEPALSGAEKKVSKFDQTVDRTRKKLDQMNRSRWQLAVHVLDRASAMINRIGALARRVVSGSYRITVKVLDFATAPFRAILRGMNSALGILGIGAGTAGAIVVPLKMVMQQQNIETAFEVLLGSAAAAKKRVEELTTFAGSTPFTRDEIYESSRILQVFTGNALSTGNGLRMVGDIAAGTQQSFGDVALWVGRLYDAMAAGRPVGEMTSRLQEMGAISGAGRDRLEKLAESGKDISKTWPLATKEFARFDGMMEKLSGNLANLLLGVKSFFMNNIIKRWGQGLTAGITPLLQSFRQWRKDNSEGIAKMGDQVERVASRFSLFFVDRVQIMSRKLSELFNDDQFKNADLFGKLKIAWDKIISEPFAGWWAGGGKERIDSIAANIGGALGAGLNSVLLGLLGMGSDTEAKISDSPFIEAGASAGRSFLEAFLEAFDAKEIAGKAKDAFLNLQPTWLGGETSSGMGQALALMMDAWFITKVGKLLKGPLKAGRAARRWTKGRSAAADTVAATTAATRATATAAEATGRSPWYSRWFGGSKNTVPAPVSLSIPTVPTGPAANLPTNYRPAGKQFWDNIPLDRIYNRDEVVHMANSGSLQRFNQLEKAFKPTVLKTSWWKGLFKGGGKGLGFLSRSLGKVATPLAITADMANIAAAAPGEERNRAIGGSAGGWSGFAAGSAGGAALGSVVPGLGTAAGGLIGGIVGSLGGGAIGEWIGSKAEDISDWFSSTLWPSLKDGASATWTWISDTAPKAIAKGIGFAVGYIGETLFNGEWWGERWKAVEDWSAASWEQTQEIWNKVTTAIGETVFNGEWWQSQWNGVKDWASNTWESARDIWNSARDAISETLFSADWWQSQWKAVEDWASNAWGNIKSGWGKFWDKVGGAFSEGREAGKEAATGTKAYARGGFITSPHLGLVGEAGPEAIIPLSAHMRGRGRELWEQAGQMLGVRPFASGGIVGTSPSLTLDAPMSTPGFGGISINLGGVNFSFEVNGDGQDVIESIREHGEEIADYIGGIITQRIEDVAQNSI